MYDSSFNRLTLGRKLVTSDFFDAPALKINSVKEALITDALNSAKTSFGGGNPLAFFLRRSKQIYRIANLKDELVIRKICRNLNKATKVHQQNRDAIVSNITKLIAEGVPYRIYRLDIKSFYESFSSSSILEAISTHSKINPTTKKLISDLLKQYAAIGGTGLPRGLPLSATISELLMSKFDDAIRHIGGVFFYARYVDDILIITKGTENSSEFKGHIKKLLPSGLRLNHCKQMIRTIGERVSPAKSTTTKATVLSFDYLGYRFTVSEPVKIDKNKKDGEHFRDLCVDISESKIKKLKTRITRSFLDFSTNRDFELLRDRVKFLTTNFRIKKSGADKYRMAGIYYSYPLLTTGVATGLSRLDKFLKNAIHSKSGRVFSKSSAHLTAKHQRELLGHSFTGGHNSRCRVHFNPKRIKEVQECWANE
jgi:hypothetical protein